MHPRTFDSTTLIGLLAGFAVVAAAIALGGSASAFVDMPALLIVAGGTLAVTAISFSWIDLVQLRGVLAEAMARHAISPAQAAVAMLRLAEKARREGSLTMEAAARNQRDLFLRNGLQLVADNLQSTEVEMLLRQEILVAHERRNRAAAVLRKAAEVAPAMGLIGTLVGLVQMLGQLGDPSAIGPGMAIALLTTLYGALFANMVLGPLAARIERNADEAFTVNTIYLTALVGISRQENPRRLETILNGLLPEQQRIRVFA